MRKIIAPWSSALKALFAALILCTTAVAAHAADRVRITGILVTGVSDKDNPMVIELADVEMSLRISSTAGTVVDTTRTTLNGRFSFTAEAGEAYEVCWSFQRVEGCRRVVSDNNTGAAGLGGTGSDSMVIMGYVPVRIKEPFTYGTVLTGDARPCWVQDSFFELDVSTDVRGGGSKTKANTQGEYIIIPRSNPFLLQAKCEKSQVDRTVTLATTPVRTDVNLANHAPQITSIAATDGNKFDTVARMQDTLKVVSSNRDLEGHTVEYRWKVASKVDGIVSGSTVESEEWQLGEGAGRKTLYAVARDGFGGFAFRRFDMETGSTDIVANGRVLDSSTGNPVAGATVSFGGAEVKTDGNGWFDLAQEPNADRRYVLNIEHPNFALISRILDRSARGATYPLLRSQVFTFPSDRSAVLEDTRSAGICNDTAFGEGKQLRRLVETRFLDPQDPKVNDPERPTLNINPDQPIRLKPELLQPRRDIMIDLERLASPFNRDLKIDRETRVTEGENDTRESRAAILKYLRNQQECERRGIQISLQPNSFVDGNGEKFNGTVRASLATLNPAIRSLPGDYQAITENGDRAELLSFGALYAEFTDLSGNKLQLRSGVSAEIRTPVSSYQSSSAKPEIAQWSYDTKSGFWREEGKGQLQNTADGPRYVGKTSHFSTLNMDVSGTDPATATCARFEVGSDFASWSNLTIRAYVSYNGDSVQVKETPLNTDQYHAIFRIPYGNAFPPNTLRLELRGTSSGQDVVLLDDIINTDARPKMTGTDLWPDYPYTECGDPILLTADPGIVPPYGDIDGFGRPAFLTGPRGDFNPADGAQQAIDYYAAIDPLNEKDELGKWWVENGFGADGLGGGAASYVNQAYLNDNDLGFGRDMHCRSDFPSAGDLACYVTNYGLPDQSPGNADAAETKDVTQRGATVTMEYDASGVADERVQFYVYGGGDSPSGRINFADLDGMGPKPVPFLCQTCHGGGPDLKANNKAENARFREFDLPSFKYSSGRSWDFGSGALTPAELDRFADLNEKVAGIHPGTPIAALIDNWYTGPFSGAPVEPAVPPGWSTETNVYHEVYGKACRTCHIARDGGFALVFDTSASLGFTGYTVCGVGSPKTRVMPNAAVTYRNFWADTNRVLLYETLIGQAAGTCDD